MNGLAEKCKKPDEKLIFYFNFLNKWDKFAYLHLILLLTLNLILIIFT
jgi:hypothetical protein